MFRKMRRFVQQISDEECREVLRQQKRGVLSVLGDDGYPYGVPIDFLFVEESRADDSNENTSQPARPEDDMKIISYEKNQAPVREFSPAGELSLKGAQEKEKTEETAAKEKAAKRTEGTYESGNGLRGKIYFHGAKVGHKQDAIKACDKVSFCVMDDEGYRKEGEWALNIRSVIAFGRIRALGPEEYDRAMEICRGLCHKFTDDETYIEHEIQHAGPRVQVLELTIEHLTGKLVNES